jgi:DNA-binding NarL/FixJ family response regulator
MASGTSIRILLAEDHEMVRAGLRSLLAREPGVEVVGEAGDGRAAVRLAEELAPDVVLMDVGMPGLNGLEATRQITANRNGAGPRVIALSGHSDRRVTTEMLKAGATGYVMKEAAFQDLAAALRSVMEGKVYVSPAASQAVVDEYVRSARGDDSSPSEKLSPRERQVLQLLAEGKSTKQIALALGITTKTVETHRSHVKEKLGIDSVAGLTKYALRTGLTPL